ncbi:T9SS type B sorting domain-containing protein [Rhodoflexus sp.]
MIFGTIILLPFATSAQRAGNYAFSTVTSASLLPMNDATTTLVHGPNTHLSASPVIPIGFEFWFMGVRYTDFSVNSNGVMRLGNQPIVNTGNAFTIAGNARLVPFVGTDFNPQTQTQVGSLRTSATGRVHFRRGGTAPNRFLIVESRNMAVNFTSNTADATFQIVIYETAPGNANGGRIEFRYGQVRSTVELNSINIGIGSGDGATQFLAISLATLTAREGVSSSNPISPGAIPQLNSTADGQRRQFTFDPPVPNGQLTDLTVSCLGSDAVQLQWRNQAANAVGTVLYRSTDGINYQFLTQVNAPAALFTDRNIEQGRTYHYRAYAVTEGKLSALHPTGQVTFSPQTPPPLRLPTTLTVCRGQSVTLDAGAGYPAYEWSDGQTGQVRTLRPNESQTLRVVARGCGEVQAQVQINVVPIPVFQIGGDSTICAGELAALLEAPRGLGTYRWQNERGQTIGSSPTLTVRELGKYFLTVTTAAGCSFRDSIVVTNCCQAVIEMPTAFTPHSTPANNLFRIRHDNLQSIDIQIYNRWGNLVYRSSDPEQGWDGTFEGKPAQAGVYQVIIQYTSCQNGFLFSGRMAGVLHLLE